MTDLSDVAESMASVIPISMTDLSDVVMSDEPGKILDDELVVEEGASHGRDSWACAEGWPSAEYGVGVFHGCGVPAEAQVNGLQTLPTSHQSSQKE